MNALSFFILSILMAASGFVFLRRAEMDKNRRKQYAIWLLIWAAYLVLIINSGIIPNVGPFAIPLFIVIPALVSIILFARKLAPSGKILLFPIFIQTFRIIVEVLIFEAYEEGIMDRSVTFYGTNFDIVVGLSAPLIGWLYTKRKIGLKGVLYWNYAGLAVLAITVASFIRWLVVLTPRHSFENLLFIDFPYILLPGILVPAAVFYHLLSILNIRRTMKS